MAMTKDDDDVAVSIYHTCIRFRFVLAGAWKITHQAGNHFYPQKSVDVIQKFFLDQDPKIW